MEEESDFDRFIRTNRNYLTSSVANVTLGLVVAKIYYDNPRHGYFVFAAYYFLMCYEFYGFIKANWHEAWYGVPREEPNAAEESSRAEEQDGDDSDEESDEDSESESESDDESDESEPEKEEEVPPPRPRLPVYPPPVDSDDEKDEDDDDDTVEVELGEEWDNSDDDYHEAEEGLFLL